MKHRLGRSALVALSVMTTLTRFVPRGLLLDLIDRQQERRWSPRRIRAPYRPATCC